MPVLDPSPPRTPTYMRERFTLINQRFVNRTNQGLERSGPGAGPQTRTTGLGTADLRLQNTMYTLSYIIRLRVRSRYD